MKQIKTALLVFLILIVIFRNRFGVCDNFPKIKIGMVKNESQKELFVKLTSPKEDTLMDSYSNYATFAECYVKADTLQDLITDEYGLKYWDSAGCHVYIYDCAILRKYLKGTDGNTIHPDAFKKAFLKKDTLTPQQIRTEKILIAFVDSGK